MSDVPNRPTIPFVPRGKKEVPEVMPGKLWDRRLYHGSSIKFNVGDRILPAETLGIASNYDSEELVASGLRRHAFATWDISDAQHWAGGKNIYLVSPINDAINEKGLLFADLDQDPFSETGVRSKTGFDITGRFTEEGLEHERAVQAAEKIITGNVEDLRFSINGQSYFLHASKNEIKVGEKIKTMSLDRLGTGMASDSIIGRSYGFDALNPGSIHNALSVHGNGYIYITAADAAQVVPDLNVNSPLEKSTPKFYASNARAIKRRANYFR